MFHILSGRGDIFIHHTRGTISDKGVVVFFVENTVGQFVKHENLSTFFSGVDPPISSDKDLSSPVGIGSADPVMLGISRVPKVDGDMGRLEIGVVEVVAALALIFGHIRRKGRVAGVVLTGAQLDPTGSEKHHHQENKCNFLPFHFFLLVL